MESAAPGWTEWQLKSVDNHMIPGSPCRPGVCQMHRPWDAPAYAGVLVEAGPGGQGLTKTGFLAMWAFMAAAEPRAALEQLLLLGYDGDASAAFAVSRPRRLEHRKGDAPGRSVYQACPLF